jgi:hypothetical protein
MRFIYLAYIVPGSVVLPIVSYSTRRKKASAAGRSLFVYLILSSLLNLTAILLATHHRSNLWVLHLYTAVEAVLLLRFYERILAGPMIRLMIRTMMVLFPLACLADVVLLEPLSSFNTFPRSLEAILFILLSGAYWLDKRNESEDLYWAENPINWMISGLLLYFASDFLLFLCSNFLLKAAEAGKYGSFWDAAWTINGSLVLLMYILFAIGFRK